MTTNNTLDLTFGTSLIEHGTPLIKRPSVVYAAELAEETTVITTGGLATAAKAGDFVLYDPTKRSIWTSPADYVGEHYEPVTLAETTVDAADNWVEVIADGHVGFDYEDFGFADEVA